MENEYDVIIVGTGIAGLYSALQFKDTNLKVLLISKRELTLSNSSLAQGGIAAVLDRDNDDFSLHINDTMIAGKQKNNPSAVRVLVTEGPEDVKRLYELGVDFDKNENGSLAMTLEAGHSRNRIVHHKDSTGKEVIDTLIKQVKKLKNVHIFENAMVFDIQKANHGFFVNILINDNISSVYCRFCLLCTGGIGRVYKYTTNSAIATGDGIALAYKMGAKIKNLSLVQFHPTAFAAEKDRERFLISEAVRGEGAYLKNCYGKRFAFDYDERGELAPRDVVSNAIILESRKLGNENFYLDITYKDADFIKNRFPMIYEKCLAEGIDITKDKIPVFPCQHYLMGGIDIDLFGRTSIDRLYASGECSHSGVHGENRLASNSLLEALVFSRRASRDIIERLKSEDKYPPEVPCQIQSSNKKPLPKGFRTEVRELMQDVHFVIQKPEKVSEALKRTSELSDILENGDFQITPDFIEAKSLVTIAYIIFKERSMKSND